MRDQGRPNELPDGLLVRRIGWWDWWVGAGDHGNGSHGLVVDAMSEPQPNWDYASEIARIRDKVRRGVKGYDVFDVRPLLDYIDKLTKTPDALFREPDVTK
jgi:hypothetical protein